MLVLRIAPPKLDAVRITPRTWLGEGQLRVSTPTRYTFGTTLRNKFDHLPCHHWQKRRENMGNENGETSYVIDQVIVRLQSAGLLKYGDFREVQSPGYVEHCLVADENTIVPIVFKSTHNLLIPTTAAEAIRRYNNASIDEVKAINERNTAYNNIGNPLAQLIKHMVVAGSRYGVLSSGSRSYFIKVVKDKAQYAKVLITYAWFVGQKDYLKAWSCWYQQEWQFQV